MNPSDLLFTNQFDINNCQTTEPSLENLNGNNSLKEKNELKELKEYLRGELSTTTDNFENIVNNNPGQDKLLLFHKSQKLLDRILFVLFAEDRGLLPDLPAQRLTWPF